MDPENSPASSVSSIRARFEQLASSSPTSSTSSSACPPFPLPTLAPATLSPHEHSTQRGNGSKGNGMNAVQMERGGEDASRSTNSSQESWHSLEELRGVGREGEAEPVPSTPTLKTSNRPPPPPKPTSLHRSATLTATGTAKLPILSTDTLPLPIPHETRPTSLVRASTSYRKAPPPPPNSRQKTSVSFASSSSTFGDDEEAPPTPVAPTIGNLQPQTIDRPPSPTLSVKSIASRFDSPEPPRRSQQIESSSANPFGRRGDETQSNDGSEAEGIEYDEEEEEDEIASDSTYTSSDEDEEAHLPEAVKQAAPMVPPRPSMSAHSDSEPILRAPPPLPARSGTASSTSTNGSSTLAPTFTESGVFSGSPANSISNGSPAPPCPVLPPRADTVPPLSNRPPDLPMRPTPSQARSPSPTNARTPTVSNTPYVPPPPPTRTVHATEKITPRPPTIHGGDGSSDEEELDEAAARAQEFPDATFANRRPPTLRQRRQIQSNNHFYSYAMRGHQVVTAHHRIHIWRPATSSLADEITIENDKHKFLCLEFRAAGLNNPEEDGRFVWAGTKDGHLYEFDLMERSITQVRTNLHAHPVSHIFRIGRAMLTLDDSGKCHYFPEVEDGRAALLGGPSRQQRVPEKQTWAALIGDELWTSSGPITKQGATAVSMRSPQIRVFDPTGVRPFSLLPRPLVTPESAGVFGAVTASAVVPSQPNLLFLGHDNGFVSVWDRTNYSCVLVQRLSPYSISALVGVKRYLWAGFRTGNIYVYDVDKEPWTVLKAWKAHKDPIVSLVVDPSALWTEEILQVASATADEISLWDGFLRDDWLDHELHLRQPDFCTFRSIRALCVSWNIDASRPHDLVGTMDNLEFLKNALHSTDSPDIISFGFQEMIDLEDKKLTAKSMLLSKKKTTDKLSNGVSSAYRQWHDKLVQAVRLAMPPEEPYTVVHVGDMVGLFSCIFVKTKEADRLRDISLITVKTGMGGRYGNKGAILSRFVIDDTSLCFINVHLAAGHSHARQRNRDLVDILEDKASFSDGASSFGAYSPGASGTNVFDHELTILSGDLNYRIDARRDFVISAIASGQASSLLPFDQLNKTLATNQTFRLRSFREPTITFPPTYKYDPGTDNYDSSVKRRIPAWCDRILYRADRADKVSPLHYKRYEVNVSDHRPISAAFDLQIKSIVPEKRSLVWNEIENSWKGVEKQVLEEAKKYYEGF
ncbi:uncharacterized protein JCM6883_001147 [Sporobolomyces salmoneus]|uniref:uncharacterized protein n=1 Tax=Sporobolomyces salmoneus TaxID=183962 RepID=UPI00317CFF3E